MKMTRTISTKTREAGDHAGTLQPPRCQLGNAIVIAVINLAGWLVSSPGAAQLLNVRFKALEPFDVSVGADVGLQAFALADLNGDRILDLVTIDQVDDRVLVFRGKGDGTFASPIDFEVPATPTVVAVADVGSPYAVDTQQKKDGKPDIVVGSDAGDVQVFYQLDNGSFGDVDDLNDLIDSTGAIAGIAVRDFDGNPSRPARTHPVCI